MIFEYNTILENTNNELIEKKSKFIGNLFHVENEQDAKGKLNEIKKKYYDAKHHVFAYIVCENGNIIEKYSDDGEPSGTAGKPILEILKQRQLYNVIIIITRYFGGILLGTGGLAHAYSDTALLCINNSLISNMKYCSIVKIIANYDEIDKIKYLAKIQAYGIEKIEYSDNILIYLIVEYNKTEELNNEIKKILNRNVDISVSQNKFVKK